MLYSFELQMAGVILLGAMAVCGAYLWFKRRAAAADGHPDAEPGGSAEPHDPAYKT